MTDKPWYQRSISAKEGATFPPAKGRYVLLNNYGCPFACRAATVRHLLGLDSAVALVNFAPAADLSNPDAKAEGDKLYGHDGWVFNQNQNPGDALVAAKDPVFGVYSIREVYDLGRPEGAEPFYEDTVPCLVDSVSKQVVSSESADIVEMFWKECKSIWSEEAKEYVKKNNIDLYPEEGSELAKEMKEVMEWVQEGIVFGVYGVGYAENQESYEKNQRALFAAVERLDKLLDTRRYLAGATVTFADVSLAQALTRWEIAYKLAYRVTYRELSSFKNVYAYFKDVVQVLKINESAYVPEHIIQIYFGKRINPERKERFVPLVPAGFEKIDVSGHGRDTRPYHMGEHRNAINKLQEQMKEIVDILQESGVVRGREAENNDIDNDEGGANHSHQLNQRLLMLKQQLQNNNKKQ